VADKEALVAAVKEAQSREWERLLDGIRCAYTPTRKSIAVRGSLEVLGELIPLVGPTPWNEVPWPIYLSGLYAHVIGRAHLEALPAILEHSATVILMQENTNQIDVQLCTDLLATLRKDHP
jgi:hypothetical protein